MEETQSVPVYLFWGEEFLVRKDAEELVKKLVPDAAVGLNLVVLDGASPKELAAELATLPLFPGPKVVTSHDPEFLAPKKGRGDGLHKAKEAWRAGKRKEGARRLLALAARAGWGPQKLDPTQSGNPTAEDWKDELNVELGEVDLAFLKEVSQYCRDEGLTAPESDAASLIDLLTRGLPQGHVLVIAATDVDGRHPLVKWTEAHGRWWTGRWPLASRIWTCQRSLKRSSPPFTSGWDLVQRKPSRTGWAATCACCSLS